MRSLGHQGLSRQHLREYAKHRTPMDPFAGGKLTGWWSRTSLELTTSPFTEAPG